MFLRLGGAPSACAFYQNQLIINSNIIFMKPNDLIRSLQKGMKARHRLQLKFFLSLMTFFAIIFIVGAILDHESAAFCMTGFGGVSTASMMAIGSVGDVSDKFTFGSNITYQVYLIDINQLDRSKTFPKPYASRQVSSLPMLN